MKSQELRIGNWVFYSRDENPKDTGYWHRKIDWSDLKDTTYLHPIPLTEDWLVRFGFEITTIVAPGIEKWNQWYNGTFNLHSGVTHNKVKNDFVFVSGVTIRLAIKYVHQLQNLYFALTGEELTIHE